MTIKFRDSTDLVHWKHLSAARDIFDPSTVDHNQFTNRLPEVAGDEEGYYLWWREETGPLADCPPVTTVIPGTAPVPSR